jgi:DNA-binding transcriptional MocR family regulator
MHVIAATTTRPGDLAVTEAVTYAGIKAIAALLGLQLRGLPIDEEGLDPQAFADACRRGAKLLYTTPTLHNPTSATMSVARRRDIAKIAEKHGVTIVEDDVYGFLSADAPLPIATYAPANTYYLVGTSKSIAPGIRVGYAVCPHGAAQRIANAVRTTVWETSPVMSAVVTKWIQDGTAARIMAGKQAEVRARHQIASSILTGLQPPSVATPHWWVRLPAPWHADDLTNECRQRGLIITPASTFAIERENVPPAVRICLAAEPTRQRLQQGLELFRDILDPGPKTYFSTT